MHSNSDRLQGEKIQKKGDNGILLRPGSFMQFERGRTPRRVETTKGTQQEHVESVSGCQQSSKMTSEREEVTDQRTSWRMLIGHSCVTDVNGICHLLRDGCRQFDNALQRG